MHAGTNKCAYRSRLTLETVDEADEATGEELSEGRQVCPQCQQDVLFYVPHHHLVCREQQPLREELYTAAASIIINNQKKRNALDIKAVIAALWFNVDQAKAPHQGTTPAKQGRSADWTYRRA